MPWWRRKCSRTEAAQCRLVAEKLARLEHTRLAIECAKLDSAFEQALAEEGLGEELDAWRAY
jgi:hypothetical protein